MTNLLVAREVIKKLFSKYEIYAVPVLKGLLAFTLLNIININIGYMERINNVLLVLVVAALCSFLPLGFTMLFSAIFTLLHLYEIGIEMAGIGAVIFVIIYFLFLRFSPKDAFVLLVLPVLFLWEIPYVVPLAVGLIATPMSIVSVSCGVIIYYFLQFVATNALLLKEMGTDDIIGKVRMVIDGLITNDAMFVMLGAFAFIVLSVFLVRKLSIDYAWTIAIIVGAIINILAIMIGDLILGTNQNILWLIGGTLLSVIITKILEFFIFNVDYSRTERVQFEDDDYYYYVKAIPKVTMPTTTKTVKQINSRTNPSPTKPREGVDRGRSNATRTSTTRTNVGTRNIPTRPATGGYDRTMTVERNAAMKDEIRRQNFDNK